MENKEKKYEFESIMDSIISKGHVEKEKEIITGMTVRMKALSSNERIQADSISMATRSDVPYDVICKIRIINILARAILSINKVDIGTGDDERIALYSKLMDMPPLIIDKMYDFYVNEIEQEERNIYNIDLKENIENF